MMKRKSQADRILAHLRSGKTLTARQAFGKFGCMRLAARINEINGACLPGEGAYEWVNIEKEMVRVNNLDGSTSRVARYYLP